jgi:hypothetical protein
MWLQEKAGGNVTEPYAPGFTETKALGQSAIRKSNEINPYNNNMLISVVVPFT